MFATTSPSFPTTSLSPSSSKYSPHSHKKFPSSPSSPTSQSSNKTATTNSPSQKKVLILRGLLFFALVLTGGLSGGMSYYFIRKSQNSTTKKHFHTMINDHFRSLQNLLHVQLHLNIQLATTFSLQCPTSSDWPLCTMSSHELISRTRSLLPISKIHRFITSTIVSPHDRLLFESFGLNYYQSDGGYPLSSPPQSSFIYNLQSNLTRIKSSNHTNPSESQYDFLVPILLASDLNTSNFFYNTYSNPSIKQAIEEILLCVDTLNHSNSIFPHFSNRPTSFPTLKPTSTPTTSSTSSATAPTSTPTSTIENDLSLHIYHSQHQCSTSIDLPSHLSTNNEASSLIITPVFTQEGIRSQHVVGFISAIFQWEAALSTTLYQHFDFNCHVKDSIHEKSHSYQVENGIAVENKRVGETSTRGNKEGKESDERSASPSSSPPSPSSSASPSHSHDKRKFMKSFTLRPEATSKSPSYYTITYYSTNESPSQFFALATCLSCIGVALVISLIFLSYNLLTDQESHTSQMLLNSKRAYVRFISHEIRTPLNTIKLSTRLLSENILKLQLQIASLTSSLTPPGSIHSFNPLTHHHDSEKSSSSSTTLLIEECMELLSDLEENSSIAVTTLSDLINYDKIGLKTFSIEKKDVNVWTVLEKTIQPLSLQAKEKNIDLEIVTQLGSSSCFSSSHPPSHAPPLSSIGGGGGCGDDDEINLSNLRLIGDSIKLGQVIRNLVSNALKFTPVNGEVKISAYFRQFQEDLSHASRPSINLFQSPKINHEYFNESPIGEIIISISDTGPGLTVEQQRAMFQEGVQFNPNELQAGQGSGLGMWISKEIVTLHQGRIGVKSHGLGHGTTFEVTLPVVLRDVIPSQSHLPPSHQSQSSPPHDSTSSIGGPPNEALLSSSNPCPQPIHGLISKPLCDKTPLHVLIVDDANSNRKLLSRLLQSRGFHCSQAINGQECLNLLLSGEEVYDLILMDYEMPILNGPLAAKAIRDQKMDILIIGITGNILPEDREYFKQHGANEVFSKPVNIDELIQFINEQRCVGV